MPYLKKPYFPNNLEVGIHLRSIPELIGQLSKYKPEFIILHITGKDHKRHFPNGIKVIECDQYEVTTQHPVDGSKNLSDVLQGSKFITFDDFGEGYNDIFYHDGVAGDYSDADMPQHMTVADLVSQLEPYNNEKNFFVIPVRFGGDGFVSPDLMMNYNNATYKIVNKDKGIFRRDIGMEGMVCFGVSSTMSNDWGESIIHLKPKGTKDKMIQEQKENFNRFLK
jgi:hypothetical protein